MRSLWIGLVFGFCVGVLFLLVSCSYPAMTHPVRSQSEADRDAEYCRTVAESRQGVPSGGLGGIVALNEAKIASYKACMMERGYSVYQS